MARYRKRPLKVDAFRYTDPSVFDVEETNFIPLWVIKAIMDESIDVDTDNNISIKTLEGTMKVSPGDYIVRGTKGEFYPCKPDIFEEIYELVEE